MSIGGGGGGRGSGYVLGGAARWLCKAFDDVAKLGEHLLPRVVGRFHDLTNVVDCLMNKGPSTRWARQRGKAKE